jgi:hypothetical protein
MTSRMNWRRVHDRAQIRRWGGEEVSGGTSRRELLQQEPLPSRRHGPDKDELRKQAAAAFLQWRARQRPAS